MADGDVYKKIAGTWTLIGSIAGPPGRAKTAVGVFASLPTTGMAAGDSYKCTDSPHEFIYQGGSWQAFVGGLEATPVILSDLTVVNQGGSTISQQGASVLILDPSGGGSLANHLRLALQAVPSAPYKYTIIADIVMAQCDYNQVGICLYDSGSGKLVMHNICSSNSVSNTGYLLQSGTLNSVTSFNAEYAHEFYTCPSRIIMRIRDDGTNRYFGISADGFTFWEYTSSTNTDWITPTHIGFYANANNGGQQVTITVHSATVS